MLPRRIFKDLMAKYSVTYEGSKSKSSFIDRGKGFKELIDQQIVWRDAKTVEVEANSDTEAIAKVSATLPAQWSEINKEGAHITFSAKKL